MISTDATTCGTPDTVEAGLLDIIRRNLKAEGAAWTAATTMDEAQIDSFDLVELVFEIEDRFGVEVQFNANSGPMGAITFGDVVAMIRSAQAAKTGQAPNARAGATPLSPAAP